MLYPENIQLDEFSANEDYEYLIDAPIFNDDINTNDIAALEKFYQIKGYIPEKYIPLFLNYITYYTRYTISKGIGNPLKIPYRFLCSRAASLNSEILSKMKIDVKQFNVGDVMGTNPIHELCEVMVPTMVNGEIVEKKYILDPTFKQFCIKEENRFERYNEEPRYGVRKSTPHPAYFFNLYEDGLSLAQQIIRYGYYEATTQNLKIYFDGFYYYLKDKEKYENQEMVGKEYISPITGEEYEDRIKRSKDKKFLIPTGYRIVTPLERINTAKNNLKYKIRSFFTKKDEYKSDLDLDENLTKKL